MNQRYVFLTIFLLLLGAYAALHWGLVHYLALLFPATTLWPWIALLGASSVLCLFAVHWRRNILTQAYYILGVTWMGVAFVGFFILLLLHAASALTATPIAGEYALGLVGLVALLGAYGAFSPGVKEVRIPLRKRMRRPLRVVQLSDIHMGEVHRAPFLRNVVKKTNALLPDVVVITGDLFDGGEMYPGIIDGLQGLRCKHVLFVTGNHEVYTGSQRTTAAVRRLGIRVLENEIVTIDGVQFAGMAEPERNDPRQTLIKLAGSVNKMRPAILLRHTPSDPALAASFGFDVQLSGHTHAGQIWPFNLLVLLLFRPTHGVWRKSGFTLYTSAGTGTWGPPMRIGSRSEITLITLEGAGA